MAHNQPRKNNGNTDSSRQNNNGPASSIRPVSGGKAGGQKRFGKGLLRAVNQATGNLARFFRQKWTYVLVAVIALLPGIYFFIQSQDTKNVQATVGNLQTTAEVVNQVSKHILLPSGEQPTVATVTDASKVRDQTFFSNSASGDKVLIYAQAKKAYLYRPSIDRVIEVAPLAPNEEGQNGS
jgi:hypothetical protein